MAAFKALIRYLSYLFQGLLALFLLGVSALALASGTQDLHLAMLPWTGHTLLYVLFFGSLFGLLTVILAARGRWPFLFFLWTLAVAVLLIKGYIFTGYHFAPGEPAKAAYLMLAAILSVLGAWWSMFVTDKRRGGY